MMAMAVTMVLSTNAQTVKEMSVREMFELIEQNNRSIQSDSTGVEVARMGVKAARSQMLPDISAQLNGSFIGNAVMLDRDFTNAKGMKSPHLGNQFLIDVRQTIYAGGAINAGINLAELGVRQAELNLSQSRLNQRFLAIGQYLDLEKIAHRQQVIESNIILTKQLIDNINEKHRQGVALKNDVTRYELQLEKLKLSLTQLQNSRSILNHQLCNTLGLAVDTKIEPVDDVSIQHFEKEGEEEWQMEAAHMNPQIQMAGVNEQMMKAKEKLAKSDLLPKVAIVAQNNFNGPITFELPLIDKNLDVWFLGVGVQYQLSSLFKSNKKLKQARLESRQAAERKNVAAEQLNNQVQAAYTNYLQSYVELETQQKNVELAQQNYQVVNNRYLNQLALITDMIDASNMKLEAELNEVDARINIAYAYYKMKFIAGKL